MRRRLHLAALWALSLALSLPLGCAPRASLRGPRWYGQGSPRMEQVAPRESRAEQHATDVDFERLPPQRLEALRQSGVQVPQVSGSLGDAREHRDFIERRVTAVGFGITAGGYVLYCEGLELPVLVPESQVDLGLTSAEPLSGSIYPDREAALVDLARAPGTALPRYAYYRGAGGALIVPTVFSPASTPRVVRTMLEVRQQLVETTQQDLKVLLLNLTGARVLQGVFSRVVRLGTGPAVRPQPAEEGLAGRAAAPPPPVPRPAAPAPAAKASAPVSAVSTPAVPASASAVPASTPTASAPGPARLAPAPAVPAPVPGALAPSPGLVQALAGKNPTLQVAPGQRLPQDVAVDPSVPKWLSTDRPVSQSATQNAQVQADIRYLRSIGAKNIQVNQQQLSLDRKQRLGINRPDVQFDYENRRYHIEYDTPSSGRGAAHQSRTTSNDPNAIIILLIVP